MIKFKKSLINTCLTLLLIISCKQNKKITENFEFVIVFSKSTAYFFDIKKDEFIKDNTLFIKSENLNKIINKNNKIKKILLTQEFNNKILSRPELKNKIFHLKNVKFHLKKSIDFLLNGQIESKELLLISDESLNKEDSEYLQKKLKEKKINSIIVDKLNISYLKNFITYKIKQVIILSLKYTDIYLKIISESPFFNNVNFVLIGNFKKNINLPKIKYLITIKISDLINITKKINDNFKYEFNIFK